ncbi:Ff.00g033830.m01.CDS01 [Fusarium sp. VM40]|nr:Ff.00g033830.m01.CDS01 [Fusarium sp. VM40]
MTSYSPTYIPSPNWDIPADSNTVVLGRLIKDPKNPESKIAKSDIISIQESDIYDGDKTDWETTLEQVRSGNVGFWAKCMQIIGGGLSFSQIKSSMEKHRFDHLETKYFLPDDEYFSQVLEDAGAKAYLHVHRGKQPIYLITGIKVARGASVTAESSRDRSVKGELKAALTSVGAPVDFGPDASWRSEDKQGVSYGGSTDYIFAYQLTRIKQKKGQTETKNESYVKGAVYGKGEQSSDSEKIGDLFEFEEEANLGFPETYEEKVGDDM